MLLTQETINKFGYDPHTLKKMSGKRIVYSCITCNKQIETQMSSYTRSSKMCLNCSKVTSHKNKTSGYNSIEYRKKRSEIAKKSNKKRKIHSEKYKKYLPFLEDLKNKKITFTEIAKILNVDDSSVCRFFHDNFDLKSRAKCGLQELEVEQILKNIFPNTKIETQKRYEQEKKYKSDFYIENIGHIEYDGNGFYHIKQSDDYINNTYKPIRINAQVLFGKEDYLNYIIKNKKTGYCAVKTVKEYRVEKINNRKLSTKMLENCHKLGNCAGTEVYGLYYENKLIGVAKFGNPTNKHDDCLELRRFFVLDGTPKNAESYFLRQCEKNINKTMVTYIHEYEKGSYLKALGWEELPKKEKMYDVYLVNGKVINKRRMWGWAKKVGLVDKFGTTNGKEILAELIGAKKIIEPSKKKFKKVIV